MWHGMCICLLSRAPHGRPFELQRKRKSDERIFRSPNGPDSLSRCNKRPKPAHAAIVTGEVHNPPSREIAFHHEPLLAPGPSEHHIVLDEQNSFALLLNISKGTFVTGYYKGERYFVIPFFVEPGDSLHAVVTFAEVTEADSAAAVESDSLDTAEEEAPPAYSLTFSGRGAENNRFLAEFLAPT